MTYFNIFSDFNLNEICSEECSLLTVECIQNCDISDSLCISSCLREESICIEKCPCGNECPGGCDDQCENSICQCSDFEKNQDWSSCIDQNSLRLALKMIINFIKIKTTFVVWGDVFTTVKMTKIVKLVVFRILKRTKKIVHVKTTVKAVALAIVMNAMSLRAQQMLLRQRKCQRKKLF